MFDWAVLRLDPRGVALFGTVRCGFALRDVGFDGRVDDNATYGDELFDVRFGVGPGAAARLLPPLRYPEPID